MEVLLPEPKDFQQYVFIHMDTGLWGWARMCTSARERGRWRPQAQVATVRSQDAGANIVEGEKRAIRLA